MWTHAFSAMGTIWHLSVDSASVSDACVQDISAKTAAFEKRFSRFIADSEVSQWRNAQSGTYGISPEFATLLQFAQNLKIKSDGLFDPAVGSLLEHAGYDSGYSFNQNEAQIASWQLPQWHLSGTKLTITGPLVFDLGGFAKGFWIDQVSALLLTHQYPFHLVDGGGDMFATTKASGEPWRIAIEYPGKTDTALGTVGLVNQGFAASDVFKRSWKDWHHLINLSEKKPQATVVGAVAVANTAMEADGMTALLMLTQPEKYQEYYKTSLDCEYLVLTPANQLYISPGWPGEVFT